MSYSCTFTLKRASDRIMTIQSHPITDTTPPSKPKIKRGPV